jgi:hypothetical protein
VDSSLIQIQQRGELLNWLAARCMQPVHLILCGGKYIDQLSDCWLLKGLVSCSQNCVNNKTQEVVGKSRDAVALSRVIFTI